MQCFNALQRLEASYVNQEDLDLARGGSAEFTDLMRVLVSLRLYIEGGFGELMAGSLPCSLDCLMCRWDVPTGTAAAPALGLCCSIQRTAYCHTKL